MILQSMYYGRREVTKVYRAGKVIWPISTEVDLSFIMNIFTGNYHVMLSGETVVLSSLEATISVPEINPLTLPVINIRADAYSQTNDTVNVLPMSALICVCDAASTTQAEINTLITNAVSFVDHTDILSDATSHSLVAYAIYGDHMEDSWTTPETSAIVAGAVYGEHGSDVTTDAVTTAEVPIAVYGSFAEDNANADNTFMYESPSAVNVVSQSDNATNSTVTVIPFRVDGVVEMDAASGSQTQEAVGLAESEHAPLTSMLRLVTTCRAHVFAASAASVGAQEGNSTAATIFLHFEGEKPEESWYDPVQTGSNLYIRSAWLFWRDGDKGHIDTDVWYEVIRDGSNLYIRSVDSSWQDDEKAYIDLSVFYEPKQTDDNLYIRSAASVWTDGDSANIDTEFFLEPVQEGSNLHIRQDIFGGV